MPRIGWVLNKAEPVPEHITGHLQSICCRERLSSCLGHDGADVDGKYRAGVPRHGAGNRFFKARSALCFIDESDAVMESWSLPLTCLTVSFLVVLVLLPGLAD